MRGFFKGWRRKMGCVTLCLALSIVGIWMRSYDQWDSFDYGNTFVDSREGVIQRVWDARNMIFSGGIGSEPETIVYWRVPYWSIVLLLTLLSAYLLLVKPRVAKPKIVGEN